MRMARDELDSSVDTGSHTFLAAAAGVVHRCSGHVDHGLEEKQPRLESSIEGCDRLADRDAACVQLRP